MEKTAFNVPNSAIPFATSLALQRYRVAERGIEEAKAHGFSHWYIDFSIPSETPDLWSHDRVAALKRQIAALDVYPFMHSNFKAPIASDVEELRFAAVQYVKKEIDLAALFDAPLIIHAGGIVEPRLIFQAKARALDNFIISVNELTAYADNLGVTLWLENLSNYTTYQPFYYIFTTPGEFSTVLSACPKAMLFFDIGHANIGHGDPCSIIKQFHDRLAGIVVNNNDGVRDQHVNMDNGTVDYEAIMTVLKQTQWSGALGFEVRDMAPREALSQLVSCYQAIECVPAM